MKIRHIAFFCLVAALVPPAGAVEVKLLEDLPYRAAVAPGAEASAQQCALDLYLPAQGSGYPSIVWLHGGGLTGGSRKSEVSRRIGRHFAEHGVAVAMADYRLNPGVVFPAYVDDAAAAWGWLHKNIATYGGDSGRVFVGGHSAGAYLALMLALEDRNRAHDGFDAAALAGVVAVSGQAVTHFTVRAERNQGERIIVDDAAPLHHVARRPFPFFLLYAGKDMALRLEENRLLAAALRAAECSVADRLYADRDHGTIVSRIGTGGDVVADDILQFIDHGALSAAVLPRRVLLIGDSISFGYAPHVAALLADRTDVQRIEGTVEATVRPAGGLRLDTAAALQALPRWLGSGRWDVIHFNWGLHDVRLRSDGTHQVELPEYEGNLRQLVSTLKRTGAALVWASTTPIPPGTEHGAFARRAGDELAYNRVAAKVMTEEGVAIDDLHAFAVRQAAGLQQPANVHFTEAGSRVLAGEVARSIETALAARAASPPAR